MPWPLAEHSVAHQLDELVTRRAELLHIEPLVAFAKAWKALQPVWILGERDREPAVSDPAPRVFFVCERGVSQVLKVRIWTVANNVS